MWSGLYQNDPTSELDTVWMDGSELDYTHVPQEMDSLEERCTAWNLTSDTWWDDDCTMKHEFLCREGKDHYDLV